MVTRGAVLLVVSALAVTAGLAAPREAQAFGGGPDSPYSKLVNGSADSSLRSWFKNLLLGRGTPASQWGTLVGGESTASATGAGTAMTRAQIAARVLPKLVPVAGRLTLAGTALYIGWRVSQHYADGGASDEDFDFWLDADALGRDRLLNPLAAPGTYTDRLRWFQADWAHATGSPCTAAGAGTDCYVLILVPALLFGASYKFISNIGADNATGLRARWPDYDQMDAANNWSPLGSWDSFPLNSDPDWGKQVAYLADRTLGALDGQTFMGRTLDVATLTGLYASGAIDGHAVAIPFDAMGDPSAVRLTQPAGTALPGSPSHSQTHTVPSDAADTSGDRTAVGETMEDDPCFQAAVNYLYAPENYEWPSDCWADPPSEAPGPLHVPLPAPYDSGESFAHYQSRLAAAGIDGAVVKHVETGTLYPSLPNGAVVKVMSGEEEWETINWPSPLPQVVHDGELEVYVNPGTYTGATEQDTHAVPLPQPRPDETAAQYRQRLRDLGFIGTIIIETLEPEEVPGDPTRWNPSQPVEIVIGDPLSGTPTRTITVDDPWPDPPPVGRTDDPVRITQTPPDLPTRTAEPPPGVGNPQTPACDPWLTATPDFGPLLGLDFGDSFPFAVFGWVAGFLAQFDVTPVAPSWHFDLVIPATAVGGPWDVGDFDVDLDWASDYMATVRTMLAFVLWAGAAWFFATGLLGIRAPGNPAEAVDEA